MSFYNLMFGRNDTLAKRVSPFLPRPPQAFPRFRDVFLFDEDSPFEGDIFIYTRMGAGNRECLCEFCEEGEPKCSACICEEIEEEKCCVGRYDDEFDSTYSTFVFRVADEDRALFEAFKASLAEGKSIPEELENRIRALEEPPALQGGLLFLPPPRCPL